MKCEQSLPFYNFTLKWIWIFTHYGRFVRTYYVYLFVGNNHSTETYLNIWRDGVASCWMAAAARTWIVDVNRASDADNHNLVWNGEDFEETFAAHSCWLDRWSAGFPAAVYLRIECQLCFFFLRKIWHVCCGDVNPFSASIFAVAPVS